MPRLSPTGPHQVAERALYYWNNGIHHEPTSDNPPEILPIMFLHSTGTQEPLEQVGNWGGAGQ